MTQIVETPLPHKVGSADIASAELKDVVMKFMENFLALDKKVSTLQSAAKELQGASTSPSGGGGGGGGGGSSADSAAASAQAAANAANVAVANAASAVAAKNAAEAAVTDVWRGVNFVNSIWIHDKQLTSSDKFFISDFVIDKTLIYAAEVVFTNKDSVAHTVGVSVLRDGSESEGSFSDRSVAAGARTTFDMRDPSWGELMPFNATTSYICAINGSDKVDVLIKIYLAPEEQTQEGGE